MWPLVTKKLRLWSRNRLQRWLKISPESKSWAPSNSRNHSRSTESASFWTQWASIWTNMVFLSGEAEFIGIMIFWRALIVPWQTVIAGLNSELTGLTGKNLKDAIVASGVVKKPDKPSWTASRSYKANISLLYYWQPHKLWTHLDVMYRTPPAQSNENCSTIPDFLDHPQQWDSNCWRSKRLCGCRKRSWCLESCG